MSIYKDQGSNLRHLNLAKGFYWTVAKNLRLKTLLLEFFRGVQKDIKPPSKIFKEKKTKSRSSTQKEPAP
jgi:hypothetical protein